MNNYVYDEGQSTGHGFSFSTKQALDANSPRVPRFYPISEKSEESSFLRKTSRNSSSKKGKGFNLAPELTLDDLRERLKQDDHGGKQSYGFDESGQSSLKARYTPKQMGLLSSPLERPSERGNGLGETSFSVPADNQDTNRHLSTLARSSRDPYPLDAKNLSSPVHSYSRSVSSHLKSSSKYSPGYNTENSENQYIRANRNYLNDEIQSRNYYVPSPGRHEAKTLSRSRSPTSTKSLLVPIDTNRLSTQQLGGSVLGNSAYSVENVQQDLKDKIEQFNKRLGEIQEELSHSKVSQDPYKISLHSMKTLPKDDAIDGLSLKERSEYKETPIRFGREETSKGLSNKDDKDQPLRIDYLTGPQNSKPLGGSLRRDYTQGFKEMKARYSDMFVPQDLKMQTNPFKILKYRYGQKLEKSVKGYLEQTAALQEELDYSLFNAKQN